MTLSNILVIDSSFRDTSLYPLNTSFGVPVNAPRQQSEYVDTPLVFFQWTPTQLTITGTISGGTQKAIILSLADFPRRLRNYYVGCTIEFLNSSSEILESSMISEYDPTSNSVELEYAISSTTLSSTTNVKISYWDSVAMPYSIQITGYTHGVISEYTHLFVYNRTKNLMFAIQEISRLGLVTLETSMGNSYHLNDQFEIRNSPSHHLVTSSNYYISILFYELLDSLYVTTTYREGDLVLILPEKGSSDNIECAQIYKITGLHPFMRLELVSYGGNYSLSSVYYIVPEEMFRDNLITSYSGCLKLSVIQIAGTFKCETSVIPDSSSNVLYFGDTRFGSLLYFRYSQFKDWIIVDNFDKYTEILLDVSRLAIRLNIYFLSLVNYTVCSNVANSSFPQNPVCFDVSLETLILPNRFVKGYRQLLSFFPYVIVKLYNISASNKTKNYVITSNNPTSTISQFLCPIGNLLNPSIIRFVEVASDMTQSLQLNFYDDLYFEVCLPNGKILEYDDYILPDQDNLDLVPNYTLVLENRKGFTVANTVCAIFSIRLK